MRFLASFVMSSRSLFVFHCLRLLIGLLMIYAGLAKVIDPLGSVESVRNYDLIGDPWAVVVAMWLPWVEMLAGLLLLCRWWMQGALLVVSACALVFAGAIGSAWLRGLDISCGCFGSGGTGGSGPVSYAWHLVGLAVLFGACFWMMSRRSVAETQT